MECDPVPRIPRMPCQSSSIRQPSRGITTSASGASGSPSIRARAMKCVDHGAPEQ